MQIEVYISFSFTEYSTSTELDADTHDSEVRMKAVAKEVGTESKLQDHTEGLPQGTTDVTTKKKRMRGARGGKKQKKGGRNVHPPETLSEIDVTSFELDRMTLEDTGIKIITSPDFL